MECLWMGDVSENMTESMIMEAFQAMGESPVRARIKRNMFTGVLTGYCVVIFPNHAAASTCLENLNGKLIPDMYPPKTFQLKHALYTKPPELRSLTEGLNTEYMQPFIYYSQQFQHTLPNWKYDQKSNRYSFQQYGYTADKWQVPEGFKEEAFEVPSPSVNVNEANKEFMQQSEELYDALLCSHCHPLYDWTSNIPTES
ncbi:tRNA selenocysteine 1-associated protein 1-like [Mixophyes fleayi]|uniref:tRNA selenocysteine 1-associated protein 1-like n=1 Tax=Mixophyes fleayi TaxID=3061075 RepID=UPI003F4DF957